MKPKIDYFDLMIAVDSHYRISMLYGWPPMFNVHAEEDEAEQDLLASVESREGAFNTWVTTIHVYSKSVDEYLQRLIGLDYYKVRVDHIGEEKEEEENDDVYYDEEEEND